MRQPENQKKVKVCPIVFIFLFFGLFKAVAQEEEVSLVPSALTTGNVYALIIGISDYKDPKIKDLRYAHRDAEEFYNYLLSPAGGNILPSNIRLLKNQDATVSNIYVAINWLQSVPKKGDIVYFYFAGHGDVENGLFELGFLLAYDSPFQNYLNNAVRIEDINNMANTLSVTKDVQAYLITDACHSGKLAGSDNRGKSLVGSQLSKVMSKEVRLASCEADQLSEESELWGGGRGAFSWYLINGLKGLADANTDSMVTFQEIKTYLEKKVPEDVAKLKNKEQFPVLDGKATIKMAIVNKMMLEQAAANLKENITGNTPNTLASRGAGEELFLTNEGYFFRQLDGEDPQEPLEKRINFKGLIGKGHRAIVESFLETYRLPDPKSYTKDTNFAGWRADSITYFINNFDELESQKSESELILFREQLAAAIHNRLQEVINLYLEGDEGELEKRSYYNVIKSEFDEYVAMARVAAQLLDAGHPLYQILKVKEYYFEGVVERIKIPFYSNRDSLISLAFASQSKVVKMAPYAAFINNELGILSSYRNELKAAKKYFKTAISLAPSWSVPWSNLSGIYIQEDSLEAAKTALNRANILQPDLLNNAIRAGIISEKESNWLQAEEHFRKAIYENQQFFVPYDRLGNVYLNTTDYAAADSFFYESYLRKLVYDDKKIEMQLMLAQGAPNNNITHILALSQMEDIRGWGSKADSVGDLDTTLILRDDIMAYFYLAMRSLKNDDIQNAERLLKKLMVLSPLEPLAFHYLGKVYFDQKKWTEAEVMFKLAVKNYKNQNDFKKYADSLVYHVRFPYDHGLFYNSYLGGHYRNIENYYFLGTLYESWAHYDKAAWYFKKAIEMSEKSEIGGELKLYRMYEKLGRYTEAEDVLRALASKDAETGTAELNRFYRNTTSRQPQDGYWPYKLGQLLYTMSEKPSACGYTDTIIYFPVQEKEVFVDMTNRALINATADYTISLKDRNRKPIEILNCGINDIYKTKIIPGTNEAIPLNNPVNSPRKDGIFYLNKAADLLDDSTTIADIQFKLGDICYWAGSKKQALRHFQKSLAYKPDLPDTRMKIVDMAASLYENTTALKELSILNDSNRINIGHRKLLARYLVHSSQYQKVKNISEKVRSIYPYDEAAIDELEGKNELISRNYKKALPHYLRMLKNNPNQPHTLYNLARIYALMKDKKSAFIYLKSALKNGFNYSYVLAYDEAWSKYRKEPRWNELMQSFTPKDYLW